MSHDRNRQTYSRERDRDWDRNDYRNRPPISSRKRSRSPVRNDSDKRRSRSPRKMDKDLLDENILSEISKLPEPSELWDSQFQDTGFAPPPPSFQQESASSSNYGSNYQGSYPRVYDDFPTVASLPPAPLPPEISSWNQMSLPPAPPAPPAPFINNVEDQIKKEAAIESEMRHQKAALSKQREDYMKKAAILKKELDTLKDQRNELRGDSKRSPSPDTKRFLKENTKLQLEIQNKLKTINNVVDMLNGIIGEEAQDIRDSDDSADRTAKRKSRSPSKFNYVYYDPEMHWCRVCNEFPSTAKDYLNHLHSPQHHKMAAQHMEAPWHSVTGMNEGFPSYPSAPTKRTPIRGLQFFVPSTAWYCKLCDLFIGDLHCASAHLKSIGHSKNYTNFVEQNPHWETDWMSDRQKAIEKVRTNKMRDKPEEKPQYTAHTITFNKDGFHTKRKDSPAAPEEKKKKKDKKKKTKKKRSSSSSSSSDSSSSGSEPVKKKKKVKSKQSKMIDPDDKTLTEWMSSIQVDRLNDSDRKLLDNLKNKIKQDNREEQKRRAADAHDRGRERSDVHRKLREIERREARGESRDSRGESRDTRGEGRDTRGEGRDSRGDSRDLRGEEREGRRGAREGRRGTPPLAEPKKPEKKMPFIGKMPVYKNLAKNVKTDEKKLEEQKKKEEEEAIKKKQQELDVEIQKKVAEFKEKIAKAQLERSQGELPPPALALPTTLGAAPPPHYLALPPRPLGSGPHGPLPGPGPQGPPPGVAPQPQPNQAPNPQQPNLPKDFQDALDIIFPSEAKKAEMAQQDIFATMPPFPMGGPLGGHLMPSFPPLGLMQPRMPQLNFGFDMNGPLFPPRPQLYDNQVPLLPSHSPRPQNKNNKRPQNQKQNNRNNPNTNKNVLNNKAGQDLTAANNDSALSKKEKENAAKKKEELDDLAMLGIDASDVGAGI